MDFCNPIALSSSGPAQESPTRFGFTPVTSHFKQLSSTLRLWLTRSAATHSAKLLNDEHSSFRSVPCGIIPCTSSCFVSFFSRSPFKSLAECVAALRVSHSLNVELNCLKWDV